MKLDLCHPRRRTRRQRKTRQSTEVFALMCCYLGYLLLEGAVVVFGRLLHYRQPASNFEFDTGNLQHESPEGL